MKKSLNQSYLTILFDETGLSDQRLAGLLDINQSTLSRLRNNKIQKISGYISKLEDHLGRPALADLDRKRRVETLVELSEHSPAIDQFLAALLKIMQENA